MTSSVSAHTFTFRPRDYSSLSESERKAHVEEEKALLYVAMTRAVSWVHLSGVGEGGR